MFFQIFNQSSNVNLLLKSPMFKTITKENIFFVGNRYLLGRGTTKKITPGITT